MNRKQRREAKKRGEYSPLMGKQQVVKLKEDVTDDVVAVTMCLLFAMPIKVLKDKYGWGCKKRLPEFADLLAAEYQKFADSEMTLEEYADSLYQECGIKFEKKENR